MVDVLEDEVDELVVVRVDVVVTVDEVVDEVVLVDVVLDDVDDVG